MTYRIELWDIFDNKYIVWWKGNDIDRADIMMNKPYVRHLTRRLIKTTEEILYVEKGKKK